MTRTILYARISTLEQTADHQLTQARDAGFMIDEVISDEGISGVTTRLSERHQGKRLFDILRKGDTLVVRWIDRLGRNYEDVTENIRQFIRRGVTVKTVINNMTFDGAPKDPMQMAVRDALIGFMAAMAQAQAEATKEAQRAGIAHKRQEGAPGVYMGRKPSYSRKEYDAVISMLGNDTSVSEIARLTGLTRQTVLRIRSNPSQANEVLKAWGL